MAARALAAFSFMAADQNAADGRINRIEKQSGFHPLLSDHDGKRVVISFHVGQENRSNPQPCQGWPEWTPGKRM